MSPATKAAPNAAGARFQADVAASFPDWCWVKQLAAQDPAARLLPRIRAAVHAGAGRLPADLLGAIGRVRFSTGAPFDLLVLAVPPFEWSGGLTPDFGPQTPSGQVRLQAAVPLALELKSVAGKSLPHAAVKDHQWEALEDLSLRGVAAGLLVQFRGGGDNGAVVFVPGSRYAGYRRTAARASLPLEAALALGVEWEAVAPAANRRPRWKAGRFVRRLLEPIEVEL